METTGATPSKTVVRERNPRAKTKDEIAAEMGRRLRDFVRDSEYHPAWWARKCNMSRDRFSTYYRGDNLPNPENKAKLLHGTGLTEEEELFPNWRVAAPAAKPMVDYVENGMKRGLTIVESEDDDGFAMVQLNMRMPSELAGRIREIVQEARAAAAKAEADKGDDGAPN